MSRSPQSLPPAPAQAPAAQEPPPDRAMGIIKLIAGLALAAVGGYLILFNVNRPTVEMKIGVAIFLAVIFAAGVRLLLTGGAQATGRRFALIPSLIVFVVLVVAAAFALPRMWASRAVAAEQEAWERLEASPKKFRDYEAYKYSTMSPRRGVLPAMALAETREALAEPPDKRGRVSKLRGLLTSHLYNMEKTGEPEFKDAIDLCRQSLTEYYTKALAELGERIEADNAQREFPEDPQMRAAFAAVLSRIAKSDDDLVYLDFMSDNQIPQQPAGASKDIPAGEAFSSDRDARRRSAFSTAMTESLKAAFKDERLIQVQELGAGTGRNGKAIFEVKCTTRRAPGGFTLTRNDKEAGTLFNFEVDWQFAVIDADGKVLATNRSRSNPAGSVRFSTKRDDPDWAPYSVLMDSAYYNYCREITGRLGLIPPPVKESFTFSR